MTTKRPDTTFSEAWKAWADWTEKSQKLWAATLASQVNKPEVEIPDPDVVRDSFRHVAEKILENPEPFLDGQATWWRDFITLCEVSANRLRGVDGQPVAEPEPGDKRFKDDAWTQDPLYDHIKQSYLITARVMTNSLRKIEGIDPELRERIEFYTRQTIDALAPTNFVATNPVARRATLESGGQNLLKGIENMLRDMERGKGRLRVAMTDETAFEVGRNIAVTPGKVVFQNDLMQLIQYAPATETVRKRPLLVVPPWINKFYILDLTEKNSLLKYMVDQGFTVFVISWINPDETLAHKNFENYVAEGPLAALDAIEHATGEKEVTMAAYCIGGTLTASTLALMAARGDDRVKAATFFTTMTDFEDPGELGVFIEPHLLDKLDDYMAKHGYLDGSYMSTAFNMLRDNDLIWSFFINNYLLGKDPMPFDLLYWNSDSTRMPAMMHSFYLREMYEKNKLVEPGGITLLGTPIDLRAVKTPVYMLSTKEDHIAPWRSTFRATGLFSGPTRFVLSGSGHIAGVINPPTKVKYGHWTNSRKYKDPDAWFNAAKVNEGSWWPNWTEWNHKHSGPEVPARHPGDGKLKPIEDAPGSYVKVRV
ncbi:MAG: class I poly(R)-hydroxyalkanoic acid synthase [Rhodospirillum sp.]|nr:class I poly(R)-hydroxyalkanoic acid synthase [Rhodospirillum sp.]MCF8488441.1 class I poly(R)-hydroxyalkanoic acid synthase [Rhodospirillum sp.]MCF8499103.1 class I poly(R)-hydroxyalkanoic acid synthase [Rhodospirillum sp.]